MPTLDYTAASRALRVNPYQVMARDQATKDQAAADEVERKAETERRLQAAADLQAQQTAAKMAQEAAQAPADLANKAAELQTKNAAIAEADKKNRLELGLGDVMATLLPERFPGSTDPAYQTGNPLRVPFHKAPPEVHQSLIDRYGTDILPKVAQKWNETLEKINPPAPPEGMTPKSITTTDPMTHTATTYAPTERQSDELTEKDMERGRLLASNTATIQQLFGRGSATNMADRTKAMQAAEKIAPGWTAQNYAITEKARKEFTGSGDGSKQIGSLNTILDHIGQLDTASKQLRGSGNQLTNKAANWMNTTLRGDSPEAAAIESYKTHALGVASEIAKLLKGSGPAGESEIEAWQNRFSPEQAPGQMKTNIEEALKLIKGRVNGLHEMWESAFDTPRNRPFLSKESMEIVRKLGADPNTMDPGKANGDTATPAVNTPPETPEAATPRPTPGEPAKPASPGTPPPAPNPKPTVPTTEVQPGMVRMTSPEGVSGMIPADKVEAARARGFR